MQLELGGMLESTAQQVPIKRGRSSLFSLDFSCRPKVQSLDLKLLLQTDGQLWTSKHEKKLCSNAYGVVSRRKQKAAEETQELCLPGNAHGH